MKERLILFIRGTTYCRQRESLYDLLDKHAAIIADSVHLFTTKKPGIGYRYRSHQSRNYCCGFIYSDDGRVIMLPDGSSETVLQLCDFYGSQQNVPVIFSVVAIALCKNCNFIDARRGNFTVYLTAID